MNSGTGIFCTSSLMSVKLQTPRLIFSPEWYRQRWGVVILSKVIKFPYSDTRSQGPQGMLRSRSAPNNQTCGAAANSLRWRGGLCPAPGTAQSHQRSRLPTVQAESKDKGEMQNKLMSPPLRSPPRPPGTPPLGSGSPLCGRQL